MTRTAISPVCETLKPGATLAVWVRYIKPKRRDGDLFAIIRRMLEEQRSTQQQQQQTQPQVESGDGEATRSSSYAASSSENTEDAPVALQTIDSTILAAALHELYPPRVHRQLVPCYVKPLVPLTPAKQSAPAPSAPSPSQKRQRHEQGAHAANTPASPHGSEGAGDSSSNSPGDGDGDGVGDGDGAVQRRSMSPQFSPRGARTPSRPSSTRASSGVQRSSLSVQRWFGQEGEEAPLVVAPAVDVDVTECSYLDVEVPEVPPVLAVVSNDGRTKHDYGPVLIGQKAYFSVDLLNMSADVVEVHTSVLDSAGAFATVRAVRAMQPGSIQRVTIAFWPQAPRAYYEQFDISCAQQTIKLRLFGQGAVPSLRAILPKREDHCQLVCAATGQPQPQPTSQVLVFHDCLVGDTVPATLKLRNDSVLPITFSLAFASHQHQQGQGAASMEAAHVAFDERTEAQTIVRPQQREWDTCNVSGAPAFSCDRYEGSLQPQEETSVVVSFSPDRESLFFRDLLRVSYSKLLAPVAIDVRGRAWQGGPFLIGGAHSAPPPADNLLLLTHCEGDGTGEAGGSSSSSGSSSSDGAEGDGEGKAKGSKKSKPQVRVVPKVVPLVYSLATNAVAAPPPPPPPAPAAVVSGDARDGGKRESAGAPQVLYKAISHTLLAGIPVTEGSPAKKVTGECTVQPLSNEAADKGFSLSVGTRAALDSSRLLPIVISYQPGHPHEHHSEESEESEGGGAAGSDSRDGDGNGTGDADDGEGAEGGGDGDGDGGTTENSEQGDQGGQQQAATGSGSTDQGGGVGARQDSPATPEAEAHVPMRQLVPGMKVGARTSFVLKAGSQSVQYDVNIQVTIVE